MEVVIAELDGGEKVFQVENGGFREMLEEGSFHSLPINLAI